MFKETEVDFPQDKPGLAIFRITRRLGERDSLNILTRIRELRNLSYQTFVLDLRNSAGLSGPGLGMISFLANESVKPLPILGTQASFGKLFSLTKLDHKILMAPSEGALWPLLERLSK